MTFLQACAAIDRGKTIRRAAWHPDLLVYANKRRTHAILDFGDGKRIGPWIALPEDKTADDYEIIETA